jgi:hypothetical protein
MTGTKEAGRINKTIAARISKLTPLIKRYNILAAEITTRGEITVPQLTIEKVKESAERDEFHHLERMQSKDKWATDAKLRAGIRAWLDWKRTEEEIVLLEVEIKRFLQWHRDRVRQIGETIKAYDPQSAMYTLLLELGETSVAAIEAFQKSFKGMWTQGRRKAKNGPWPRLWWTTKTEFKTRLEGIVCKASAHC